MEQLVGENTVPAWGFRGVPGTTALAGTSAGANRPIFPHASF